MRPAIGSAGTSTGLIKSVYGFTMWRLWRETFVSCWLDKGSVVVFDARLWRWDEELGSLWLEGTTISFVRETLGDPNTFGLPMWESTVF